MWKEAYAGPEGYAIIPRGTRMGSSTGPRSCEKIGHAVGAGQRRIAMAAGLPHGRRRGSGGRVDFVRDGERGGGGLCRLRPLVP